MTRNVSLVKAARIAADSPALESAIKGMANDFHPSILAELDSSEIQPGEPPSISELNFIVTSELLPRNIRYRMQDIRIDESPERQIEIAPSLLSAIYRICDGSPREGSPFGQEAHILLAAIDTYTDNLMEQVWARIVSTTSTMRSYRRLLAAIYMNITNAHRLLLDFPATRHAALRLFKEHQTFLSKPGVEFLAHDASAPTKTLNEFAAQARNAGLSSLAALSHRCAVNIDWSDVMRRRVFDGLRTIYFGPCRNCAMYYAVEALISIDPRCDFLYSHGRDWIYIPPGLNFNTCIFCGHESPIEVPAMFYVPHRGNVVYCIPGRGRGSAEAAVTEHANSIQYIRDSYMEDLKPQERAEFEEAPELITYSWEEFMLAVHMGETTEEAHCWLSTRNEYGGTSIVDGTKMFIRELLPAEMYQYSFTGNVLDEIPDTLRRRRRSSHRN